MSHESTQLIFLTTPIGNKDDITLRALEVLKEKTYFAVEDTRNFQKLLSLYGLNPSEKVYFSLHDQSSDSAYHRVQKLLQQGETVVVLSDAGSPYISDPAYGLIQYLKDTPYTLTSAPGVSSVTTALELSGLSAIPFSFHGFLPRKKGDIEKKLNELTAGTHLFFESPKRVKETAKIISELYPQERLTLLKELTKKFETSLKFWPAHKLNLEFDERGEWVIALEITHAQESGLAQEIEQLVNSRPKPKAIAQFLAKHSTLKSKEIYEALFSRD